MVDAALRTRAALLAAEQHGVLSRAQALELGLTPGGLRAEVGAGRWQRLWPGIYATTTGPLPPMARMWAASLHAGEGAALAGAAALWLTGGIDAPPTQIRVWVPHGRSVVAVAGMSVVASRLLPVLTLPAARPRRLSAEDALLSEIEHVTTVDQVVGLVLQVLQRRVTTAERVRRAVGKRARLRWRSLLLDLLADAEDGVQSRLEHAYCHRVERAHGLPPGERNEPEQSGSRRRYRDVRYRRYRLVVELDGRLAHPAELAWRDRWRDNESVLEGDRTLRYGWRDVAVTPCAVAVQVGGALNLGGWSGSLRSCGPACEVQATQRRDSGLP